MIAEGKITIDLARQHGDPCAKVTMRSNRRSDIGKVLCGRSPQEALSLLPMIFSVCGKAHISAASGALRSLGLNEGLEDVAGQIVVLGENAREHLLRVILGWSGDRPELIAQIPVAQLMSLVAELTQATSLNGVSATGAVRNIASNLSDLLETQLFSCSPEQWLQLQTFAELEGWARTGETIASQYIDGICQQNWQSVGAASTKFLPPLPMDELRQKMHNKDGGSFISQPEWNGLNYETGPLSRCHSHALVASIIDEYGAGLLARNIARLVELAGIPQALAELATELTNKNVKRQGQRQDMITGIRGVETARGRLIHSLKVRNNQIADYRILAPTEWNFHPQGPAAKGLQSLSNASDEDLQQQAHMLIQAVDPCVDFAVRIV